MLNNLSPSKKEPLIVYGVGVLITIFSCIFFNIRGYPLVNTATETLDIKTPPLYMISIFFPYGILIGELIWIWNEKGDRTMTILFFVECLIVAMFSFIRYIIIIPFSGHTIILFFFLPHQGFNNKLNYPLRFLIGIIVLIITGYYKIFLWSDPITFSLGAIFGVGLWLPGFLYRQRKMKKDNSIESKF
jgi:hypothetical protein